MSSSHFLSGAVWAEDSSCPSFPQLTENQEVDVLIIGAGITGITAAYCAAKEGKSVVVLESRKVGMGTTGHSTGNLYAPIGEHLNTIQTKFDENTLREVVNSRLSAIDFIEERINEFSINCDFKKVPFFLFKEPKDKNVTSKIQKEYDAAAQTKLQMNDRIPANFPFAADKVLEIAGQAQFNPLQYVRGLATAIQGDNCRIFENSAVLNVHDGEPCIVKTELACIKAKKVIMATHSPKGIYGVHTAMEVYREFALAVKLKRHLPEPGIYWHLQEKQHYSLRPYVTTENSYLLVLGNTYEVGNKTDTGENVKKIEEYVRSHFEVNKIMYRWAAQKYKPADTLPYIGKSPLEENIYIATGFAADGLVYGTLAAKIICDEIAGSTNQWSNLYSASRFTPVASAEKFIKTNVEVAAHLLKDYVSYGEADELKEIKQGEGKTIKVDNERLAVYRDDQNKLHMVSGICSHAGCVVHWNGEEKSWDCPCHGSRFSLDGEVLEGPTFKPLSRPKK